METSRSHYRYALLGSGRLAKHFAEYLSLLRVPYLAWSRSPDRSFNSVDPELEPDPDTRLHKSIEQVERLLILISDDEIESFIHRHKLVETGKTLIHCSGALSLASAQGAHPLMSFADELYDLESYKQIPFVTEKGRSQLAQLLPELPNSSYEIAPEFKPLYHAYCVASGNFTSLLWSHVFEGFTEKLDLPKELLYPYLERVVANLQKSPDKALTGPLVRGDKQTIRTNLNALNKDALRPIYEAFVEFCEDQKTKPGLSKKS